jgi:serine/threonine-protein kinase HipA
MSRRNQIAPQKAKLAMAVRGSSNHYLIDKILPRHWFQQGRQAGLGELTSRVVYEQFDGGRFQAASFC